MASQRNALISETVEKFCPRYIPEGTFVYVEGAEHVDQEATNAYLAKLGVILPEPSTKPAVIVHDIERNWLFLIEVADGGGPIDVERQEKLKRLFHASSVPLIFVTVFSSRDAMREHLSAIPWETDVWIVEEPTHLIQFNGQRLRGPSRA